MQKRGGFLLPREFKLTGFLLLGFGIILGVVRFYYGEKPELLNMKPFAIFSSYLDKKSMQFISNNMSEEVVGLLLLIGLFFLAFSKDKIETDEKQTIRVKSLFVSVYIHFFFLIASFLFFYGLSFVYMLIINILFPLITFIVVFRSLLLLSMLRGKKND